MKSLKAWLSWAVARLGWPGLLGLALLAAALLACQILVQPLGARADQLRAQARLAAMGPAPAAPVEITRDWRADLPPGHEAYARLSQLFQAADDAGLALDEGSYRTQTDASAGVTRLLITLPVRGEYTAIRAFLAQALNQDAALALEHLRLSRESMADAELAAEPRFALYLGDGK